MKTSTKQDLSPARKSIIRALNLTVAGNLLLAKKELRKAERELDKQYKIKKNEQSN